MNHVKHIELYDHLTFCGAPGDAVPMHDWHPAVDAFGCHVDNLVGIAKADCPRCLEAINKLGNAASRQLAGIFLLAHTASGGDA